MSGNGQLSGRFVDFVPSTMAPSASKSIFFHAKNVRLLVATKDVMQTEKAWNKLEYPAFKGTDGIFFLDDDDCFIEVMTKMSSICRTPVTRIYYIDSDSDELPIDSEVEFKEALKLIGERTNKGKFTSMRIETTEIPKSIKKKIKKAKVKVAAKVIEPIIPKKVMKKTTEAKSQKNDASDEGSAMNLTTEITQTWLENYLKQFKMDLVTDLEKMLEPHVEEQKKMSAVISSLSGAHIAEQTPAEKASKNIKKLTESDHNYSASAHSKKAQGSKVLLKRPCKHVLKLYGNVPINGDEMPYHCSECYGSCFYDDGNDDDDNLSMLSGEISLTESESDADGAADDFVDVPLPSCFNAIAPQGGSASNKMGKQTKLCKKALKGKAGKASKSQGSGCSKNQEEFKPDPKSNSGSVSGQNNAPSNKKTEMKKEPMKKPPSSKQENQPLKKSMMEANNSDNVKNNNTLKSYDQKENDDHSVGDGQYDEVEVEDDYVDVGDEEGQELDDDFGEDYEDDFDDGFVEENGDKEKERSPSPGAFQQMPSDHSNKNMQSGQSPKRQVYAPAAGQFQQNDNMAAGGIQQKFAPAQDESVPQYVVNLQYANSCRGPSASRPPQYSGQPRKGVSNSQQPMLVVTGASGPGSIAYLQMPDTPQPPKPMQPVQQPVNKVQQPVTKAPKKISTQLLIETAQAALQTQHQQIVQAAQRAALQAQQTQNLILPPSQQAPGSQNNMRSSGENRKPPTLSRCGPMPRQMQEVAQELKLWDEIDQVDIELRKWVQMCQQLMESIPKRVDESSLAMPEGLKKLAGTAVKTHQDLEKVYQNFRNDVLMVSTQIESLKDNKQRPGQSPNEERIAILPEKLMQIISSTLNTTFNILGNIAKLGMASNSGPPEPSNAPSAEPTPTPTPAPAAPAPAPVPVPAPAPVAAPVPTGMEKPQPQVSAAISPMAAAMGNVNNVQAGYPSQSMTYSYYYPYASTMTNDPHNAACGIVTDPMVNQDANMAYRMRAMGAAPSYAPNYPVVWGQNLPSYSTVNHPQSQPPMMSQPQQNQQQQPLQQTQPPMQRQFRQQMQSQMQPQLQQQLQQPQMQHIQPMQPIQTLPPMQSQMQQQMPPAMQSQFQQMQSQMQQIPRDEPSGRQMHPVDCNRADPTYSGMQLHDYAPNAPDAHGTGMSIVYTHQKPGTTGYCPKVYGGMMKN